MDASHLDAVVDELSWAYQDAKNNPFGTPMSTKQDTQNACHGFRSIYDTVQLTTRKAAWF
ncbi:hypothetical protein [Paenibacillus sp. N3.4]|uniref:hypothetical protein n=1 Tax=Paenibacillus sp. N3.4 TaxID=2603222 RepID=UPI0011C950AB|nr:hypothetical protein [Paenibacillus sp. N3.4]TXK84019.1 hypothetical protein FU659_11295 [Paenibacillus sp. N3.4]